VQPGIIETDMTARVKERYDTLFAEGLTPLPRWGTPKDVGKAVAAVASGAFPYSTGMVIDVDGGFRLRRL
jgi:3-oxoacyl-[acyl-carrier protein] reductase